MGCKNVQQKGKSSIAHKIELEEGVINKLENTYKYLGTFQSTEADLINTKSQLRNNYLARRKYLSPFSTAKAIVGGKKQQQIEWIEALLEYPKTIHFYNSKPFTCASRSGSFFLML